MSEPAGKNLAALKWPRARDMYGVEVRDVTDVVLVLAVNVAVDALAHD